MIQEQKAEEIVKEILSWLEQNATKVLLKKADGTEIAETTNITFDKDENGNYRLVKANGYVVGRAIANFHINSTYPTDVIIDIADLVGNNGTPLARNLYIGTLYAGVQDFTVAIEVAIQYITGG